VGPVTERTAFEVMPFENTIVVVHLNGETLQKLIEYLVAQKTAHPISGMQLILNPNGSLKSASIQGNPIDFNKSYAVATSNFLMGGGDGMTFFSESSEIYETGYLIRNAMIDYFKSTDTLKTAVDDRFYQLPQS
jgi:2',3'-cyclic-nucleotide 2'-phosphodiesterase (5'-nucleotidase family)